MLRAAGPARTPPDVGTLATCQGRVVQGSIVGRGQGPTSLQKASTKSIGSSSVFREVVIPYTLHPTS